MKEENGWLLGSSIHLLATVTWIIVFFMNYKIGNQLEFSNMLHIICVLIFPITSVMFLLQYIKCKNKNKQK